MKSIYVHDKRFNDTVYLIPVDNIAGVTEQTLRDGSKDTTLHLKISINGEKTITVQETLFDIGNFARN